MAIAGFNPAAEMSQLRTQRTLAMQASTPAGQAAATGGTDQAAAAAAAAAMPSGAGDAAVAATAIQEPPSTSKIVLQSVLKGALSGASVALGVKQFGPLLMKIPVLSKLLTPAIGFISKLPIVGSLVSFASKGLWQGFLVAGLVGAGVGAIAGAVGGIKQAKEAQAKYAEALAAQQAQQPQPGDAADAPPAEPDPAGKPAPAHKPRFKNWIIAYSGKSKRPGSTGSYTVKSGDTLATLATRFHTTEAEIRKFNPNLGTELKAGQTIKLKRKVVKQQH